MQLNKSAATMGETVGLGAGSGAAVGVLTALLDDNPSAKKALRNAVLGAAGGAAIGAGAKAVRGAGTPVTPPGDPDKMNLALAALTGWLPGIGPAVHGGVSQGVEQGLASGGASLAGPLAISVPAWLRAQATGGQVSKYVRPASMLASILGATGAAAVGNRMREKEAAEIVRRTEMVEKHHDHCPHCDHEFTEKGYPRPANLPEDKTKRDEVLRSGDYDEVCPKCGGIVDQEEMTDEEIEASLSFFSGDKESAEKMRQDYRTRRDKQRQRKAEREKSASMAPQDLRYWEDVNESVRKKIDSMPPEKQALAAAGSVDVTGACGHSIRKGTNGVVVEIGKKCLVCLKAGNMRKSASLRGAVLGGMVKGAALGEPCPCSQAATDDIYTCRCYSSPMIKSKGWEKSAKEAPGIRQARAATNTDPTPAQAQCGNYAKGEFSFRGIPIKIENPKGTERRGYDKHGAIKWRWVMKGADYGYIKNSKAVDLDAIDIFLGPDHDSDLIVVIDQYRGDTFDESKFIAGVTTQEQGEKIYLSNYPSGWTLGPVSTTTVPQLKAWLKDGDHKKPFKGQMVKAAFVEKLKDSVGGWLQGEGDGSTDWRWGFLGAPAAALPAALSNKLYVENVLQRAAGASSGQEERRLFRALSELAEKSDVSVFTPGKGAEKKLAESAPTVRNIMIKALGLPLKPSRLGSSYNPAAGEITLARGQRSPGILAHELGHAQGGKGLLGANIAGKVGIGWLPTLGLLSPNEATGNAAAWAGTALAGGMLASEVDASRRGYRSIRNLGGGRAAALKSFIGLPTYLAASGVPMGAHHLKKHLGGYDYTSHDAAKDIVDRLKKAGAERG